jgi:hypothetical protein
LTAGRVTADIKAMDGVDDFFTKGRMVAAALVLALLILIAVKGVLSPTPPVPISLANGTYVSKCCGSIVLRDGVMTFGGQTARYSLSVTKTDLSANVDGDPLITSDHKIVVIPGIQNSNFGFWRYPHRSNMMNLYDARQEPPNRLSIWEQDHSGPYEFVLASK